MATAHLHAGILSVHFTLGERLGGLVRDVDVPVSAITDLVVEPDGLSAARGIRAPGLAIPGVRKVGTWRGRRARSLVCVRRGQPALSVGLQGQRYDRLLVGLDNAQEYVERVAGER